MATISQERSYRAAEKRLAKERNLQKVEDGLSKAKSELLRILSATEGLGLTKLRKLEVIITKLETLQHQVK